MDTYLELIETFDNGIEAIGFLKEPQQKILKLFSKSKLKHLPLQAITYLHV